MRLVPATDASLPAVNALAAACIEQMRRQGIEQWDEVYPTAANHAQDLAAGSLLVLESPEGDLAGCVTLDGEQPAEYGTVAWAFRGEPIGVVHRLMIHPDQAGKGLAKRLMAMMEQEAVGRRFRTLRLDAFLRNPAAMRLYASLGYRRAGEVRFRKGMFACFEKGLDISK